MGSITGNNIFSLLDEDKPQNSQKKASPKAAQPKQQNRAVAAKKYQGEGQIASPSDANRAARRQQQQQKKTPDSRPKGAGRVGKKREFDRKSGTGRYANDKKKGGGARGWGKPGDEAEVAVVEEVVARELTAEEKEYEEQQRIEREKEEKQMTLDEFYKKKEENVVDIKALKVRSAGEGVKDTWDAVPLQSKKNQNDEPTKVARNSKKGSGAHGQKPVDVASVIEVKTESRNNNRGGFNNRGARGGRGGRGGKGASTKRVEISDEKAFPALS